MAIDNFQKRLKDSVYKVTVNKFCVALRNTLQYNSDPDIITELIKESIETDKPETRYHGGFIAGEMLAAHKNMSEKEFDAMIMQQFVGVTEG